MNSRFGKFLICGTAYGLTVFITYILFTLIIYLLTGGKHFILKSETVDMLNGISRTAVNISALITAVVPASIFTTIYKKDNFIPTVFFAVLSYIILMIISTTLWQMQAFNFLNSFDSLYYGLFIFPLGSLIGIVINCAVRSVIKKHTKR